MTIWPSVFFSLSFRIPERNIVDCPKCFKPQENLPVHLARVCLKRSSWEERTAVAKEAKKAFRDWAKQARTWDYGRLCEIIPDNTSRCSMMKELQQMGFYIIKQPHKRDMVRDPVAPACNLWHNQKCMLGSKSVKANQTTEVLSFPETPSMFIWDFLTPNCTWESCLSFWLN